MIISPRRRFLVGAAALLAAPVIVRASNIMAVRARPLKLDRWSYVFEPITQNSSARLHSLLHTERRLNVGDEYFHSSGLYRVIGVEKSGPFRVIGRGPA